MNSCGQPGPARPTPARAATRLAALARPGTS